MSTHNLYFAAAMGTFVVALISIAGYYYSRGIRSSQTSWEELLAKLARIDRDNIAQVALDLVDEAGRPLSPHALTSRWSRLLAAAGVSPVRLHDARHTCGTLMHLEGVPIAVIAAWLGHASSAFTMATYVHSQEPALADAARSLGRVVTNS